MKNNHNNCTFSNGKMVAIAAKILTEIYELEHYLMTGDSIGLPRLWWSKVE